MPSDLHTHVAAALNAAGFDFSRDTLAVAGTWSNRLADLPPVQPSIQFSSASLNWIIRAQSRAFDGAGAGLLALGLFPEMPDVRRFDHHLCHAVAACHSAPFEDAQCLVIDGEGDVGSLSAFRLEGRRIKRNWRSWGSGSLGFFYAWLTQACGFDPIAGEEWKVMGLAAFGTPVPALVAALRSTLVIDRGRVAPADARTLAAAVAQVAAHARAPGDPIMQAADLAASGQQAYAEMVDEVLTGGFEAEGGNLILCGGCALNSSYNGAIAGRLPFARVHVPAAPADDGNAVGAALLSWMQDNPGAGVPRGDGSPFLGAAPDPRVLDKLVEYAGGLTVTRTTGRAAEVLADRLAAGRIVGVMRGRAELGPRALGHRSILADPRPADMKDRINARVKGREAYRPFAPAVPADRVEEWFTRSLASPYMSFTLPWRDGLRARVPAVVHEDGTGRLQTVEAETNPWMAEVLVAFEARTDVPVVLNTSFNIMGKPIIHSVEDAIAVLMTTGLDAVMIEDVLIEPPVA